MYSSIQDVEAYTVTLFVISLEVLPGSLMTSSNNLLCSTTYCTQREGQYT